MTKKFLIVAGLSLTAALWFVGCSESKTRHTSKNLNDATALATRLSQRAVDLQANPMFRYVPDDTYNPLPADMGPLVAPSAFEALNAKIRRNDPPDSMIKEHQDIADKVKGKVELVPPGTIHPDVKASLQQARDVLQKAIDEAGDEKGIEGAKAAAIIKLASVQNMLGQVYWQEFNNGRAKAFALLDVVQASLDQAQREQTLITSLDAVLKQGANEFEKANEKANEMKTQAQAALKGLQGEMTRIKSDQAALQTAITDLTQQANEKQIAAKGESNGAKADALYEESNKLQDQAIEKVKAMQKLDEDLDQKQGLANIEQAKLDALEGSGAAATSEPTSAPAGTVNATADMVAKANAMLANVKAARDASQARLNDCQAATGKALAALATAYKEAMDSADIDARAIKDFEIAISRSRAANTLEASPMAKAIEGQAARNYASLRMQQQQLLTAVTAMVAQAKGDVAKVIGSGDGTKLAGDWGKQAVEKYEQSAKAFDDAVALLRRDGRGHQAWVYQAAAAQSFMGQALAAGTTADTSAPMTSARKELDEATNGKTKSPYLEYVRQVQRQYEAIAKGQATSAPATTMPS